MILRKWHDWLDQQKYDEHWHLNDVADELAEYQEEKQLMKKWSEASDVVYTYTRSKWTGHEGIEFPLGRWAYIFGVVYGWNAEGKSVELFHPARDTTAFDYDELFAELAHVEAIQHIESTDNGNVLKFAATYDLEA